MKVRSRENQRALRPTVDALEGRWPVSSLLAGGLLSVGDVRAKSDSESSDRDRESVQDLSSSQPAPSSGMSATTSDGGGATANGDGATAPPQTADPGGLTQTKPEDGEDPRVIADTTPTGGSTSRVGATASSANGNPMMSRNRSIAGAPLINAGIGATAPGSRVVTTQSGAATAGGGAGTTGGVVAFAAFTTSSSSHARPNAQQATATSTTLSIAPSTSVTSGTTVTFTATVTASGGNSAPQGTVTFKDGNTTLGTGTLAKVTQTQSQATYSTSILGVGNHSIQATYNGQGKMQGSSSQTQTLTVGAQTNTAAATTTNLTSSLSTSFAGESVTFTATVTSGAGTPTGSVNFTDSLSTLPNSSNIPLNSSGVATYTISTLTLGGHTITATYASNSGAYNGSSGSFSQTVNLDQGVLTYHNDISRTGTTTGFAWNPAAGPSSPYAQVAVDPGNALSPVRGAPLVLTNWVLPGSSTPHNLIIAASSANYVAAYTEDQLRAGNTTPLWRIQLGAPMQNGAASYLHATKVGVWSTPVIDPSTGLLYVMSMISSDGSGNFGTAQYHLFQINPNTGAVLGNVVLSGSMPNGPTFKPNNQDQRGALNLVNGWVYSTFATYPDESANTDYHGWVVGVSTANLNNQVYFSATASHPWVATSANPNGYLMGGALWGPGGAVANAAGTILYIATGNTGFTGIGVASGLNISGANPGNPAETAYYSYLSSHGGSPGAIGDHFNDVTALSVGGNGSLSVGGWFAPPDQQYSNELDYDLGGASPLVLPDNLLGYNMAVVAGKDGNVYLLNRTTMTALWSSAPNSPTVVGTVWPAGADYPPAAGSKAAPAYYQFTASGVTHNRVFLVGDGDSAPGLVAYDIVISSGQPILQQVWNSRSATGTGLGGGHPAPPVVSVNSSGSALVWTGTVGGTLLAFNATASTAQLVYSASTVAGLPHFAPITATSSSILVGTLTGFDAFG